MSKADFSTADDISDETLFERFRQEGNRQSLDALFERYVDTVSGLCAKMLSPHLAEEAAQETFLAIIQHARTYRNDAPFKHWVIVVTINTCRRIARKEKQHMRREDTLQYITISPNALVSPEQAAIRREELQDLEHCLKMLPADQRAALIMHYTGGLNRSAIAKALATPEGTVASWLTDGLRKLNSLMRARGHDAPASMVSSCLTILTIPSFAPTLKIIAAKVASQAVLPTISFLKIAGWLVMLGGLLSATLAISLTW